MKRHPFRRLSRAHAYGLFTAATLCTLPAFAQFGGTLTGTVTDSTGAIIPNATVTLTSEGTHQTVTRQTGPGGVFQFPSLAGGAYDLVVTAPGFKSGTYSNVSVTQEARNLDVSLTTGGASDTVSVNADDTAALQTSDATISATIDSAQLEKVPTYGRDPFNLIRTTPGITGDGSRSASGSANFLPNSVGPGGSNFGVGATENTVQISAAGQRISDNNFMVDGVSVNSLGYGGATVINPNIEAIGSITVKSASYSAEDGRNSGAQTNVVTKSGTNRLHGSAFFQYDEPGLNAYNKYGGPASTNPAPVRVTTKSRDYAASLGGPIIKDKLFAFASFEGISQVLVSFPNAFVETPQFRAAIHTQRANSIADQIVNAPGGVPNIRRVLTQSCSNPVDQTGGAGSPLCQVVAGGLDIGSPVPLTANGGSGYASFNVNNQIQYGNGLDGVPDIQYVQLNASQTSVARQFNGRLDYILSPKDQFAASAYVTKLYRTTPSDSARPNSALPFDPTNIATTFIYIHTFSPSLLNEFRANYTLFAENGVADVQSAGINLGIPYIELQNSNFVNNNHIHFGAGASPTSPGIFAENQYAFKDTVTKTFGGHTLKMGFERRLEQDNNNLLGQTRPTYTFAGVWNFFNDRPIYEGIQANPATGGAPIVNRYFDDHYYAAFIQHDWKATHNLTLNMGLRWEFFEPIYNNGLNVNYPTLGTTPGRELLDATLTPHHYLWNPQFKNFSPKVGFAYAPSRFKEKTVIRGGFAMAYNRMDDALFDPALEDGPGVFSYGICCGTAPQDFGSPFVGGQIQYGLGSSTAYNSYPSNPALKTAIGANGLPTNNTIAIEAYGASPNMPTPYSYLYSLDVQNEIGRNLILSIGYQGSTGRHYSRLVKQNFTRAGATSTANRFSNGLYIAQNDSNLYYNALNVTMSKNYKNGLSFQGTYTWSKAMDQVSSGDGADGNANQTNPQNNATELGPGDFDVRHRVTALGTYSLNYYHGGNYLEKLAFNGWQVNAIFTAHTGFPFTPVTSNINGIPLTPTSATINPVRPYSYSGNQNTSCDNNAFRNGTAINGSFGVIVPTGGAYRPGIGRNSFRGPCYQDIDLGVAKEIPVHIIGERGLFRFQAQAFNVNNKLNFTPFTFNTSATQIQGNGGTTGLVAVGGAAAANSNFAKPLAASAGRVIEFNARIQF